MKSSRAQHTTSAEEHPILSQADLNIEQKTRSNLFPWRGQFSPQLVDAHLSAYAQPADSVLDPFVGSGTVLVECARRGHKVFGVEINPAAAIMARTYKLAELAPAARRIVIKDADRLLSPIGQNEGLLLFGFPQEQPGRLEEKLLEIRSALPNDFPRYLIETLVVILDFYSGEVTAKRLCNSWQNLKGMVLCLPFTSRTVDVALADARQMPIDTHSVDLVLTSPPYINVFNYHQQYRSSVEALNWDVLPLARSEIGSNRKHRGNRFYTVVQYCLDMAQVLHELSRVCRSGARAIFVVGRESNVRKTAFYNGEIISALAQDVLGFKVLLRQERLFQNRFGQSIYEDILHFCVRSNGSADWLERARHLAAERLHSAKDRVPGDVLHDYYDALERIGDIEPSPIMDTKSQERKLTSGFTLSTTQGE